MDRRLVRLSLLLVVAVLAALPAAAEVFVITLNNGNSLETGRQPEVASWDANMILILSDAGNWIGLPKGEIKTVEERSASRGFGKRIDNTTIALGESPNDLPDAAQGGAQDPNSRFAAALDRLAAQREADNNYSVKQGVSTDQTQGIPLRVLGFGSFPMEPSPQRFVEPQDRLSNPQQ